MKTLRIKKTVYPPVQFSEYNSWAMYIFGCYAFEQSKIKEGWDKNILKLKK